MKPFPVGQLCRRLPSSLLSNLLLAVLLAALLALLRILGPQERLAALRLPVASDPAVASAVASRRFVLPGDTINGEPLGDAVIVDRIEQIAAALPAELLAGASRAPHVRYLAHAFGGGDDAPIYYGMFHEPAAALAFGCAIDEALAHGCEPAPLAAASSSSEDPPGVHCRPMRLALGAPVYEPDRCEAVD
jgi:hypothetical protein